MREPEERKYLGLPRQAAFHSIRACKLPECEQPRLVRVQHQAKLCQVLPKLLLELLGVKAVLESSLDPEVEDVVQVAVGQQADTVAPCGTPTSLSVQGALGIMNVSTTTILMNIDIVIDNRFAPSL